MRANLLARHIQECCERREHTFDGYQVYGMRTWKDWGGLRFPHVRKSGTIALDVVQEGDEVFLDINEWPL